MASSVEYSFTVTLAPKTYRLTSTEQYDLTYMRVFKILRAIGKQVCIIAEQTKNFNIHYHGIINFEIKPGRRINFMKKFKDAFRNEPSFGFVDIKQILDQSGWNRYIVKELLQSRSEIDRPPIICDDFAFSNEMEYTLDDLHLYQDLDQ